MMIALRVLGILIALIALYTSYLNYKRELFKGVEFIAWSCIWGGFIIVAIRPTLVDFIRQVLPVSQIARTADLIIAFAFIVIYFLAFTNHISNIKLRAQMEALVRGKALEGLEEKAEREITK